MLAWVGLGDKRMDARRRPCRAGRNSGWPSPAPWSAGPELIVADEPTGSVDAVMAESC
jgi:cell division transport system ATP-binding protein